jgi:hypothetical protein
VNSGECLRRAFVLLALDRLNEEVEERCYNHSYDPDDQVDHVSQSEFETTVSYESARIELRFPFENEEAVLGTALVNGGHDNSWLNWLN